MIGQTWLLERATGRRIRSRLTGVHPADNANLLGQSDVELAIPSDSAEPHACKEFTTAISKLPIVGSARERLSGAIDAGSTPRGNIVGPGVSLRD